MMRALRLILLYSCSLGLFACEAEMSESGLSIYGGRAVPPNTHMDAVALTDSDGVFCSGTALSPTLIITAAHCLADRDANDIRVYVGAGEEKGLQIGQYPVLKTAIHPEYEPRDQYKGFDSGYLLLPSPIDLPDSAFTQILTDPLEIKELLRGGSDTYLVGFGWNKKNSMGIKLETKAKVRRLDKTEVFLGGNGRDACQGDSGGPAYGLLKNGEWRVYGITSGGDDCGQGGIWGLMSANICWVLEDSSIKDAKVDFSFCASEGEEQ